MKEIPPTNNTDNTKSQGFILKTIYTTSLFVIVSLLTKVVNLICNIFLARLISKEAYGISKVYLEFAFLLLLYFPRQTIRQSAQKFCPNNENEQMETKNFNETVQLNWLINLIFLVLSIPLYSGFIFFGGNDLSNVSIHLLIFIFSANLELAVEPIIIYINIKIDNSKKLVAMTLGNYARVLSSCFFAYVLGFDLWAFTAARVFSSVFYVGYLVYYWNTNEKIVNETIKPNPEHIMRIFMGCVNEKYSKNGENSAGSEKYESYNINPQLREIFLSFVKTNILKMILTYTEKSILSFYLDLSAADKGEYSFVVDNFAIIIRFLFEPIEDSFYNLINKLKYKSSSSNDTNQSNQTNQTQTEEKDRSKLTSKLLKLYVRFMITFGILLVSYIFIVGREVITLLYTDYWATPSTIKILKIYSLYVAIISINGIIEAYSNAIYNSSNMDTYNKYMVFNSILTIFLSITLTKFDITGLIIANSINMLMRITLNIYLLAKQRGKDVREMFMFFYDCYVRVISVVVTVVCVVLFVYIRHEYLVGAKNIYVILVGGLIFIVNCMSIFVSERKPYMEILKSTKEIKTE